VPAPATYLLVMNTNTALPAGTGLYVNMGTPAAPDWTRIGGGATASNAWLNTGNAGTADGTNFIGTTDDVPLSIRVNNQNAGRIDRALQNTFWGYQAGSATTTGYNNTANGYTALLSNTLGRANTANGYTALLSNTEGNGNTANGVYSLYSNTTGGYNTANGAYSLYSNTTGRQNTANGVWSLYSNTTGNNNTANGLNSLYKNTTGNNNTANGLYSLFSNTTGIGNTALGYMADVSTDGLINATAIGTGALVNASNKVRIGNTAVTVIEGQVAYSFPSDKRFKYDIKQNVPGLEFIKKLQPVTYYFDEEKLAQYSRTGILRPDRYPDQDDIVKAASYSGEKQLHTGFLAQDVEKIAKELGYSFDGVHAPANDRDHYSLAYSQFIMPLVKSVQQQQTIIEKQNSEMDILKAQVAELTKVVNKLTQK
jgi:hypothetical protein